MSRRIVFVRSAPTAERLTVGIFEIRAIAGRPGAWRFENTKHGIRHVAFGTRAEVIEQAERQSEAWARLDSPKRGPGAAMKAANKLYFARGVAMKRAAREARS